MLIALEQDVESRARRVALAMIGYRLEARHFHTARQLTLIHGEYLAKGHHDI